MTEPNPATLRIAETFSSRQGEGKLTGTDSFFIRTSGCNLRCWFCDTPYASWQPRGDVWAIDQLVDLVAETGLTHVVLTGGEPLLPQAISDLAAALHGCGAHLTVETAGTIDRQMHCDLMSISPKFASSTPSAAEHPKWSGLHEERRMPVDIMRRLIERSGDYQIKFVVDGPGDYDELNRIVQSLAVPADSVWVMPQGSTIAAMDAAIPWLQPWVQSQGYHYCDRMQIRWFGNRRGT